MLAAGFRSIQNGAMERQNNTRGLEPEKENKPVIHSVSLNQQEEQRQTKEKHSNNESRYYLIKFFFYFFFFKQQPNDDVAAGCHVARSCAAVPSQTNSQTKIGKNNKNKINNWEFLLIIRSRSTQQPTKLTTGFYRQTTHTHSWTMQLGSAF